MSADRSADAGSGGRVDGRRNRRRLLESALAAFSGASDKITLEGIAKDAGVGIGTLYRHFPTREDLVEAVYRDELARLCGTAEDGLAHLPADAALRAWMDSYVEFVATKRGMSEALRGLIAAGTITSSTTREQLSGAIGTFLAAGREHGSLRADIRAEDVTASMAGVILACDVTTQRAQIGRMLDLLIDALRPRT